MVNLQKQSDDIVEVEEIEVEEFDDDIDVPFAVIEDVDISRL